MHDELLLLWLSTTNSIPSSLSPPHRDLTRTGNSIVMISPSTGVIEVESNLSGITKQRMMDNGIGMDMLSLSQPPLHTVPLFICKDKIKVRQNVHT